MIIGLTGGIGSGKTTVEALFNSHGIESVDADQVAKTIREQAPVIQSIHKKFGKAVIKQNYSIDKAALKKLIFSNQQAKKWLENLLHPLIRKAIIERLKTIKSPYGLLVSPLLFETGQDALVARCLVVESEQRTQIYRTTKRDGISQALVESIISQQWTCAQRRAKADDIIDNNSDFDHLEKAVMDLHQQYLAIV